MRFEDRVVIITEKTEKELLGERRKRVESDPIPCFRGGLTTAEQMGLFGKYDLDAFKLYIKGQVPHDFDEVSYRGKIRKIKGKIKHKGYIVVYL